MSSINSLLNKVLINVGNTSSTFLYNRTIKISWLFSPLDGGVLADDVIEKWHKTLLKGDEQTEKWAILDRTDDADRVWLLENDLQFKKMRKSQYLISQYPTYRNITIIYRDLGIVIMLNCEDSGDFHSYRIWSLLALKKTRWRRS